MHSLSQRRRPAVLYVRELVLATLHYRALEESDGRCASSGRVER